MIGRGPAWMLWLCLMGGVARAQDGGVADEAARIAEGKRHFIQGVALYNESNFNAALAEFEASDRAYHVSTVIYNIGLCQKGMFRYAEAIETLRRYLAEGDPKMTPQRQAEVEQMIVEMSALLVEVAITLIPDNATLVVDGRAQMVLGGKLSLAAGHHVLEAAADGYKPLRRELELVAGMPPSELTLALHAIPKTGILRLTLTPTSAGVSIDGRSLPLTQTEIELPAGGHTVDVALPGYLPKTIEISIAGGQVRELNVPLERKQLGIWKKWWFWSAAAAVAGAIATGIAVPLSSTTEQPLAGTIDTKRLQ